MKILFIGNSFSSDLTKYLQKVSGGELYVRNLYIGGCSLEMHAKNIAEASEEYDYCIDAEATRKISVNEALTLEAWDVISVQQVSGFSGIVESYEPYLGEIIGYVREKCPKARIVFHRTWAYEQTSTHVDFTKYNCNRKEMFSRIVSASSEMAGKYSLDIIPSGNAVEAARELPEFDVENGGEPITRDGFHLSLTYGRYLVSLVAYKFFTGKSPLGVEFAPEGCDGEIIEKLKEIADEAKA